MSQFDFGTIDPDTKTGTDLASDLNSWRNALNTLHRGASRPSYAQQGTLWIKEVSATLWQVMIFDGTVDLELLRIDPTNNTIAIPNGITLPDTVALLGDANVFTEKQSIEAGARADFAALQLSYEQTTSGQERLFRINTPADISVNDQPWEIACFDAIDIVLDNIPLLRITNQRTLVTNEFDVTGTLGDGLKASITEVREGVASDKLLSVENTIGAHVERSITFGTNVTWRVDEGINRSMLDISSNFTMNTAVDTIPVIGRWGALRLFNTSPSAVSVTWGTGYRDGVTGLSSNLPDEVPSGVAITWGYYVPFGGRVLIFS